MARCFTATVFAVALATVLGMRGSAAERASLIGCVASERVSEGAAAVFVLKNAEPSGTAPRRAAGSNSAKASTPIGGASITPAGSDTVGASTAKASTPVRGSLATSDAGTAGTSTSKASAPVRRSVLPPTHYELEADPNQLVQHSGHTVEVAGTILYPSSTTLAPRLKVEELRMIVSSCSSR